MAAGETDVGKSLVAGLFPNGRRMLKNAVRLMAKGAQLTFLAHLLAMAQAEAEYAAGVMIGAQPWATLFQKPIVT
jgi:hypothetical protein